MPAQLWLGRVMQPLAAGLSVLRRHPARRRPRRAIKDFQRSRVYRWEHDQVFPHDPHLLSIEDCRALVDIVYRWHEGPLSLRPGWAPPSVTDGRGRRHACGSREVIKLPRWARTRPLVLHECAHGLAADKHGPEFVRVYVDLLVRFMGLDRAALVASVEMAGIKIAGRRRADLGVPTRLAAARRDGR